MTTTAEQAQTSGAPVAAPDITSSSDALKALIEGRYFGWEPAIPGFGIRILGRDENIQYGDFDVSPIGEAGPEVIYARGAEIGAVHKSHRAKKTGAMHHEIRCRYTVRFSDGTRADVRPEYVAKKLEAQRKEAATAERERLGYACAAYRAALQAGATDEQLLRLRATCDEALGAFKFETRGGFWDAQTGTWGVGALSEEDHEAIESGATVSGPHA